MKIKSAYRYTSFAVFLLICLILLTLSNTNDAKSKYMTVANGNQTASVAKWDVSITPVTANNILNIVTGPENASSVEYTVRVNSNSEVSNSYSIVVTNVPNDIKVSIDHGTEKTPTLNTVTFTNAGSFDVGTTTPYNEHTLTFSAPLEANAANNEINIQVVFTQKD